MAIEKCVDTKEKCDDPIKAIQNDKDNIVNKHIFLKYSVTVLASIIGMWVAGYLFTKGAIAAGRKG